ncbi:MAG: cold shock domain-containing protein [Proteobacteria bacterium]|nr:cold shock domain-containing protein [Pseudomonadota bacterium]
MRFEGTIKSWNEAKGFGFIATTNGGQDVFVHVSELPRGAGLPRIGQAFSFELELDREGRKRAVRVQRVGQPPVQRHARPSERESRSPIAVIVGVLLAAALGVGAYSKLSGPIARLVAPESAAAQERVPDAAEAAPLPTTYRCDGRTHCSQMTSCAEAKYFLKNCPGVKMDGNHDGVPCEQQWCTSAQAK